MCTYQKNIDRVITKLEEEIKKYKSDKISVSWLIKMLDECHYRLDENEKKEGICHE